MSRIQVLIDDADNRRAVQQLIDQRYRIKDEQQLVRADCYVIDDQTLPAYRELLQEYKEEQHPTFCPVILIRRGDTRISVDLDSPGQNEEIQLIDETVSAPIDKQTLFRRIDNLLVRRNQSLTLTRQYQQVEARFEALFDAIPDPAFVLDRDDMIIEVNDEFCNVIGADRKDVVGQEFGEIGQFGLDTEVIIGQVRADGSGHQPTGKAIQFTDKAGSDRYGTLSIQSVTVEGNPCTVGVLTDITELKEKTERLEEFASVLAHDLRNPLQVAKSRTEIVKHQYPETESHLDSVEKSVRRMQDLITNLLTIARTGGANQELEPLPITECAEGAWQMVATGESELRIDAGGSIIRANEKRLRELFENLFRNAIEHGGSDVTVTVGSLPDGFYVEDDGTGIPEDARDDLFKMGYSTLDNGNGLGMSIVSEIAKTHNWEITIGESTDGGARFEFNEK